MAKNRVVTLKQLNIPRLEFQAAVFIAVRLHCVVKQELPSLLSLNSPPATPLRSFFSSRTALFVYAQYSSRRQILFTSLKPYQRQSLITLITRFRAFHTLGQCAYLSFNWLSSELKVLLDSPSLLAAEVVLCSESSEEPIFFPRKLRLSIWDINMHHLSPAI